MSTPSTEILNETSTTITGATRRVRLDASGRVFPKTDAERATDTASVLSGLEALDAIEDDPPGSDQAFWRAIDKMFQECQKVVRNRSLD